MDTPEIVTLDENQMNTVQEILNALAAMPEAFVRVEAYMRGRDIDDPKAEIEALHKAVF